MTFRIYVYNLTQAIIAMVRNLNATVDAIADYTALSTDDEYGYRWYAESPITVLAQRIVELQYNDISWHPENKEYADDFAAYVDRNAAEMFDYDGLPYGHYSPIQVMFEKWFDSQVRDIRKQARALDDVSDLITDSYQIDRARDAILKKAAALNEFVANVFYVIF